MNSSDMCKRFFSGFFVLLILFIMGTVQGARAGPILKISTPNGEISREIEFTHENSGIYEQIEVFASNTHYKVEVNDNEEVTATENVRIGQESHVRFTYNSESKALSVSSRPMSIPEPSTMILFGSLLLIGIVGAKKGEKPKLV